jgi:hypothetical protein
MGAPDSGIHAADQPTAEGLLTALRTIKDVERGKHEQVLGYWLSIRGDKEFPPLHDLDPLEISDAGPNSILLELIGGGQDAEIRHLGEALKSGPPIQQIIDAPNPSVLSCISKKLPIVAISRDFLAFEDSFDTVDGWTRCWVTLMPLSSCGSWVDYVYAFVSVETGGGKAKAPVAAAEETKVVPDAPADEPEIAAEVEPDASDELEPEVAAEALATSGAPGFGKLLEGVANLAGFYGQGIKAEPIVTVDVPAIETAASEPVSEPAAIEPLELDELLPPAIDQPSEEPPEELLELAAELAQPIPSVPTSEGALQSKLSEVRAMADEARLAQLRATAALHEGLSAAYDFALDAEATQEEYLRLVEEQGMKIQLRAPMAPVVKLVFNGLADAVTIAELETVLAWALKQELPRGSLAQRIEAAGGIDELLNGASRPN